MKVTRAQARYTKSILPELAGNPLAEALPPQLMEEQLVKAVTRLPSFSSDERLMSMSNRLICVKRLKRFVIPTQIFQDVYTAIYLTIVGSYVDCNPLKPETTEWLYGVDQNESIEEETTADSICMVGISGVGKSTLKNALLSCFPTVIIHEKYDGEDINIIQIVWLHVEMPDDASRSALCLAIFKAFDNALGQDKYFKQYSKGTPKIDRMESKIEQLFRTYYVGVMVIDEFQNLDVAKAGGKTIILNFFKRLSNVAKVSVMKIGTADSLSLFTDKFQGSRRAGTSGEYEVKRLKKEDFEWKAMVEVAWTYQWVKAPIALNEQIEEEIYSLCQGIPYCLFRLMGLSNIMAISSGKEVIDRPLLKDVYKQHFGLIRQALSALRTNKAGLASDLMSVDQWFANGGQGSIIRQLTSLSKSKDIIGPGAGEVVAIIDDALTEFELTKSERDRFEKLNKIFKEKVELRKSRQVIDHE